MRRTSLFVALIAASLIPIVNFSQTPQQETSRAVEGGGVKVSGWTGQVDAKEAEAGMTLNSAKFAKEGNAFHVVTGPAITYWNPANKASGDYTVKATFTESKYMNLNDHPHPYGVMIGGKVTQRILVPQRAHLEADHRNALAPCFRDDPSVKAASRSGIIVDGH